MTQTAHTRDSAHPGNGARRATWIDSLRVAIIIGVIGSHVSAIYALDVGWWYEERTATEMARAVLAGVFAPGLLFGMGLMFFVAGWFTPPALVRKGVSRFVVDRLWRLGAPTALYLFVVNPALNFFGDRAMGEGETIVDYFRRSYWDDVEFGIAWFMAALLTFSLVYAAWRRRHPARSGASTPLRSSHLVEAGAFIAVASFLVRIEFPVLSGDALLALNLWEYPQMSALFALGVLARERDWLSDGLPAHLRRACGIAAVVGVVLAGLVGAGIAISEDPEPFLGGVRLEAMLIPVIEATLALGMSLWLVDWFRRHAIGRGRLVADLGQASFVAYLAHVPITIAFAVWLREVPAPAELKFIGVFAAGAVASFGFGRLLTRARGGTRII